MQVCACASPREPLLAHEQQRALGLHVHSCQACERLVVCQVQAPPPYKHTCPKAYTSPAGLQQALAVPSCSDSGGAWMHALAALDSLLCAACCANLRPHTCACHAQLVQTHVQCSNRTRISPNLNMHLQGTKHYKCNRHHAISPKVTCIAHVTVFFGFWRRGAPSACDGDDAT
jgi:hypothetical protein